MSKPNIPNDALINNTLVLNETLSEISFKNTILDFDWKFESEPVTDPSNNIIGWFVQVIFQRPDTNNGEMGTGRGRKEFIAKGTTESGLVKTCWLLVELVVRHELMEGFRWRDKRIFNPHNSIHALASIQE